MLREGHIGLTLTIIAPAAAIMGSILPLYTIVLLISGALTGSNLPDLDATSKLVKHRGFTHTVWFAMITSVIGAAALFVIIQYIPIESVIEFNQADRILAAGIFGVSIGIGVLTHLLGDMITPRGIKPFHPLTPRNVGNIKISEKKYVWDVRNASDPLLNKGFSVMGVISVSLSTYIANTQLL